MMIMMLGRRGLWRGCMGDNDVRGGGLEMEGGGAYVKVEYR